MKLTDILGWIGLTLVIVPVVLMMGVALVTMIMKVPLLGIPVTCLAVGFGLILLASLLD